MSFLAIEIAKEFLFPHRPQNAVPSLDGAWASNDGLDRCGVVIGDLDQPDDLAADNSGNLYLSTGCQVLQYSAPKYETKKVVAKFSGRTGGLTWNEKLGLIVCVEGEGITFVGGQYDGLSVKEADGKSILCATSTLVLSSGKVLLTDGSLKYFGEDWVWDLMEKNASGRLIEITPETGKGTVVLDGLHFPTGLADMAGNNDAVLLAEGWSHSITIVSTGPGGFKRKPALSNLPGYPSRIIRTNDGYWLSLFALRTQLVEFVLSEGGYRHEMMKTIDPEFWIRPAMRATGHHYEPLQGGGMKQLGIMKPWAPPRSYGLVVELSHDVEAVRSLHSRYDGVRHGITGVAVVGDVLLAVSKGMGAVLRYHLG